VLLSGKLLSMLRNSEGCLAAAAELIFHSHFYACVDGSHFSTLALKLTQSVSPNLSAKWNEREYPISGHFIAKKYIVSAKKSTDPSVSAKKSIFPGGTREARSAKARKHWMAELIGWFAAWMCRWTSLQSQCSYFADTVESLNNALCFFRDYRRNFHFFALVLERTQSHTNFDPSCLLQSLSPNPGMSQVIWQSTKRVIRIGT
jgi:hypothetical protein